jgi:hypothetical protein
MILHRILPSITTHGRTTSTWRDKLREVEQRKLSAFALFLTGVKKDERHELYRELQRLHTKHHFAIPFVHAVSEMHDDEFRLLIDSFGTETFNLHPRRQFPLKYELSSRTRERITIENAFIDRSLEPSDLEGFNGLCIDVSHAEDLKRACPAEFAKLSQLVQSFPVRANHVSLVGDVAMLDSQGNMTFHTHVIADGGDLSYLEQYPLDFFGSLIAIEIEDSIEDQLRLIPKITEIVAAKTGVISKAAA